MATTTKEANWRARGFLRALCDPSKKGLIPQLEESFDRTALQHIDVDSIRADKIGHTYCEIVAAKSICNTMGTLHGGCIGVLLFCCAV
jgi:hypothetical protein